MAGAAQGACRCWRLRGGIDLAAASAALGRQNGLTLSDHIHIVVLLDLLAAGVALGSRLLLERG